MCVIAILPAKFTPHLEVFKKIASRWYGETSLAHFVWLNEEKQEKFVEAFKVPFECCVPFCHSTCMGNNNINSNVPNPKFYGESDSAESDDLFLTVSMI